MSVQTPLVSVVVAVYNGGRYLEQTLDSVLAQRPGPIEVITVDDGSTDNSAEIIRAYGRDVRYVAQPNSGPNAARNAGICLARGNYLAFVDQDDLWLPGKLDRQMDLIEAHPKPVVVFGHVEQFVSPELQRAPAASSLQSSDRPVPGYLPSTMLTRRSTFLRVGPFDPGLRMGELIEWISRAQELDVRTVMLPEVVVRRRLHTTNIGLLEPHSRVDYLRAIKATLDRKRSRREREQ